MTIKEPLMLLRERFDANERWNRSHTEALFNMNFALRAEVAEAKRQWDNRSPTEDAYLAVSRANEAKRAILEEIVKVAWADPEPDCTVESLLGWLRAQLQLYTERSFSSSRPELRHNRCENER
jgi:hypothetical protein